LLRCNGPGRTESPIKVTGRVESFLTMMEEGWEGCGGWELDNVSVVEVVW
jgi:hypothetical protein